MKYYNTFKKFLSANKTYIYVLLALLAIVAVYYVYTLKAELKKSMDYITNNSEASQWKKNIQDKAATNGRTYEQQLYLDAKYMLSTKHPKNPFLYLV